MYVNYYSNLNITENSGIGMYKNYRCERENTIFQANTATPLFLLLKTQLLWQNNVK